MEFLLFQKFLKGYSFEVHQDNRIFLAKDKKRLIQHKQYPQPLAQARKEL